MNRLKFLYVFFGIITLIVLVPVILIARFKFDDNASKTYLLKQFNAIKLPANLSQTSAQYQGGGLDNASSWRFTYTSTEDRTVATKQVESALEQAGFIVPTYNYSELNPIFTVENSNLKLMINMGTATPKPTYSGDITFDVSRTP